MNIFDIHMDFNSTVPDVPSVPKILERRNLLQRSAFRRYS